jgi:TonB family protein
MPALDKVAALVDPVGHRRSSGDGMVSRRAVVACAASVATITGLGAQAAAPAPRRDSLPMAGEITKPDWLARPDANALARAYPPLALFLELEGVARIRCRVNVDGRLEGCSVTDEAPLGIGFGTAAGILSRQFRMKPATLDGAPVAGGMVEVPINFRLNDNVPRTTPPKTEPPELSPDAKALAARTGAALRTRESYVAGIQLAMARLKATLATPGGTPDKAVEAALTSAVNDAAGAAGEAMALRVGEQYVRTFTPQELEPILAFFESPAGQVYITKQRAFAQTTLQTSQEVTRAMQQDARRRFCEKIDCKFQRAETAEAAAADTPPAASAVSITGQRAPSP